MEVQCCSSMRKKLLPAWRKICTRLLSCTIRSFSFSEWAAAWSGSYRGHHLHHYCPHRHHHYTPIVISLQSLLPIGLALHRIVTSSTPNAFTSSFTDKNVTTRSFGPPEVHI